MVGNLGFWDYIWDYHGSHRLGNDGSDGLVLTGKSMQLAIDTSTDNASLALVQGDTVLAEANWRCEQNHTVELMPHLVSLLEEAKADIKSINSVTVARGPGSFNGLRVGISTAKGLAFSLGIPVIGVSSLEVVAYEHAGSGLPVCAIFNAGRGEIAAAVYQRQDSKWRQLVAEHITTIDALCSEIATKTIFCGELEPQLAKELKKQLGEKAVVVATSPHRARLLAELGRQRLEAGDYDNPATLQPLYLRRPAITQAKHR
jgi:tRNA threonylcarbamoyl adenosine modification protein YeaZ